MHPLPCVMVWTSQAFVCRGILYLIHGDSTAETAELHSLHAGQRHAPPSAAERLIGSEKRARRL